MRTAHTSSAHTHTSSLLSMKVILLLRLFQNDCFFLFVRMDRITHQRCPFFRGVFIHVEMASLFPYSKNRRIKLERFYELLNTNFFYLLSTINFYVPVPE